MWMLILMMRACVRTSRNFTGAVIENKQPFKLHGPASPQEPWSVNSTLTKALKGGLRRSAETKERRFLLNSRPNC